MLQLIVRKYRWFILLCFLFFLTTFNLNNSNFFNLFFKVENVQYNKTIFVDESLKSEAMDLIINKNLFLLDKKKIISQIKKIKPSIVVHFGSSNPSYIERNNNEKYQTNNIKCSLNLINGIIESKIKCIFIFPNSSKIFAFNKIKKKKMRVQI